MCAIRIVPSAGFSVGGASMNVTVTADSEGWWMVKANGVEVDAFKSRHDAYIFARYYTNKMSNVSMDYSQGKKQ